MHSYGELPLLRATVKLGDQGKPRLPTNTTFYDVKFCPHTAPGIDPVFAVCGSIFTIICRCVLQNDNSIEVLRWFENEEDKTHEGQDLHYNSVEWSQNGNGDPLVCVTGNTSQIKVLNVRTGELVTTLIGHGDHINDLAVSPNNPNMLASASVDHSIRVWSLELAHKERPTVAILYGQGHKEQILTVSYHRKGRYILSGGMDTRVNLWMVPEDLREYIETDRPAMIHFPHFSTSEIHTDYVDCVKFYNDIIISHAAREHKIVLWRIDNFSSDREPPAPAPPPDPQTVRSQKTVTIPASSISGTRSAWGGRFQRLLQFDLPDLDQEFYVRFNLFHEIGHHPILVAGNGKSKAFFWDLQWLEEYDSSEDPTETKSKETRNWGTGEPFRSVKARNIVEVPRYKLTFRQFSWSRDGQWCIGVGDQGLITIFHRWENGVPFPDRERA